MPSIAMEKLLDKYEESECTVKFMLVAYRDTLLKIVSRYNDQMTSDGLVTDDEYNNIRNIVSDFFNNLLEVLKLSYFAKDGIESINADVDSLFENAKNLKTASGVER
jgi:hypothetical protein